MFCRQSGEKKEVVARGNSDKEEESWKLEVGAFGLLAGQLPLFRLLGAFLAFSFAKSATQNANAVFAELYLKNSTHVDFLIGLRKNFCCHFTIAPF